MRNTLLFALIALASCGPEFEPDLSGWRAYTLPGSRKVQVEVDGKETTLTLPGDERIVYRFPQWTHSDDQMLVTQITKTAECYDFRLVAIDTMGAIVDTVYTAPPNTALNFKLAPNDSLLLLKTYKDNCDSSEQFRYTFYNRFTREFLSDTITVRSSRGIILPETVWSPDSKKVIIPQWSNRTIEKAFVFDLVTKDTTFIDKGNNFTWSPKDQEMVAYIKDKSIYTMNITTGQKEMIFEGKPKRAVSNFRWDPSGDFLMIHLNQYVLNVELPMTQSRARIYYSLKDKLESDVEHTEQQIHTWKRK